MDGVGLEDRGKEIFEKIGLVCAYRLNQVRFKDIEPSGSYSENEHFELDYLIPLEDICLVGEITARRDRSDVSKKYQKFRAAFNFLRERKYDLNLWRIIGVPEEVIKEFRSVKQLRGFFIITELERFDVQLSSVPSIVPFYKSNWKLLEDYADSIGRYARSHFLSKFDVGAETARRALLLSEQSNDLMRMEYKKVASNVDYADIYTFEISPYELLPVAQVFRRDELPSLADSSEMAYQRLLIPSKLRKIRRNLLSDEDFVFPNSILVVLSNACTYNETQQQLSIPLQYGSVSIIDGQHRLFSYADDELQSKLGNNPRIMVTAIKFCEQDAERIFRYSARTFVEINVNQTSVSPNHLDAIAYDILEETTPRALAAKILLEVNEKSNSHSNKLYGLFDTNRTGLGVIQSTTVLSSLTAITNLNRIEKLQNARSGGRLAMKQGYENLFGVTIEEICQAEVLIEQGVICLQRFFNHVAKVFEHDWPVRGENKATSLRYAKMIAGFVKLLWKDFISEGADWNFVEAELENIRSNIMKLRSLDSYDEVLFKPSDPNIPDSDPRANDDYKFLHENRSQPTSIQLIVNPPE